jgi:hypothetical protein
MISFNSKLKNLRVVTEQQNQDIIKKADASLFKSIGTLVVSKDLHVMVAMIIGFLLFSLYFTYSHHDSAKEIVDFVQNKSFVNAVISNINAITGYEFNVSEYRGVLVVEIPSNKSIQN